MSKQRQLRVVEPGIIDLAEGEVGCTVRLGAKWQVAGTGEVIELWRCSRFHEGDCPEMSDNGNGGEALCESLGHGKVVGWWTGKFTDLPPNLIQINHSTDAQTPFGLRHEMKDAYGDRFELDAVVTALIYERL